MDIQCITSEPKGNKGKKKGGGAADFEGYRVDLEVVWGVIEWQNERMIRFLWSGWGYGGGIR
jgi:hypothetical protein